MSSNRRRRGGGAGGGAGAGAGAGGRANGRSNGKNTDGFKKDMWAGQSKFLVVVRVRPLNSRESRASKNCVKVMDGRMVVVMDPASESKDILRANRAQDRRYAFDHAFDEKTDTLQVYNHTTKFLIDGVLDGYNATVFAYGATGAGKTYTMLGTQTIPGLMVLTLRDLFRKIEERTEERFLEFKVSLTYIEVYNEMIRDLLTPSSEVLELREDPIKGPTVAGVTELVMNNTDDVMEQLHKGNKMRTQESTGANAESSRSHAVLQISVEHRDKNGKDKKIGKLSMVDLAGSERAANTSNRGIRLLEGANINRSLLALGNCINALTSGSKGSYVPYRDSKLTRMLKDSLGGNCRTVMIAACSPAATSFDETVNTLKYANRAKKIKTNVKRNVLKVNYHISQYENLIRGLREEIATLKGKLARNDTGPDANSTAVLSRRGERESQTLAALRSDLVENFKERMQLRRSLIDLQAQNIQNSLEVQKRQALLEELEDNGRGESPEADAARDDVEEFTRNSAKNEMMNMNIQARLADNERKAGLIRTELHSRITSEERKELLNLEYRIGLLELDNMELEHSRLLHEQVVQQRDLRAKQLVAQLGMRDKIIDDLRGHLVDAGLGHLVDEDAIARLADNPPAPPMIDFVPQRHKGERPPFTPNTKVDHMPTSTSILRAPAGSAAGAGHVRMPHGPPIDPMLPASSVHPPGHSPIATPRKAAGKKKGGASPGVRASGERGSKAPRSPIHPVPVGGLSGASHGHVANAWVDEGSGGGGGAGAGGGGGGDGASAGAGAGAGVGPGGGSPHTSSLPALVPTLSSDFFGAGGSGGAGGGANGANGGAPMSSAEMMLRINQQHGVPGSHMGQGGDGGNVAATPAQGNNYANGNGNVAPYAPRAEGYAARARTRNRQMTRRLKSYHSGDQRGNTGMGHAVRGSNGAIPAGSGGRGGGGGGSRFARKPGGISVPSPGQGGSYSANVTPTSYASQASGGSAARQHTLEFRLQGDTNRSEPGRGQRGTRGSNGDGAAVATSRSTGARSDSSSNRSRVGDPYRAYNKRPRRRPHGGLGMGRPARHKYRTRKAAGRTNANRHHRHRAQRRARGSVNSMPGGAVRREGGGGGRSSQPTQPSSPYDDDPLHPSAASVLSRLNARIATIEPDPASGSPSVSVTGSSVGASHGRGRKEQRQRRRSRGGRGPDGHSSPVIATEPARGSSDSEDELRLMADGDLSQVAPMPVGGAGRRPAPPQAAADFQLDDVPEANSSDGVGVPESSPSPMPAWRSKYQQGSGTSPPSRLPYLPQERRPGMGPSSGLHSM